MLYCAPYISQIHYYFSDPIVPKKENFIKAKYAQLAYAMSASKEDLNNSENLNKQLWSCVRTSHVETTLRCFVLYLKYTWSGYHVCILDYWPLEPIRIGQIQIKETLLFILRLRRTRHFKLSFSFSMVQMLGRETTPHRALPI